jgi:hypothetical protein
VTLIRVAVSVDHRDLDAVDETDRIDAHFAVVVTIIGPLDSWSVENPRRVFKGDSMPADVCGVLGGIPCEPHPRSLRNVFTLVEM